MPWLIHYQILFASIYPSRKPEYIQKSISSGEMVYEVTYFLPITINHPYYISSTNK